MTLLTTERLFWRCGAHTTKPESAPMGADSFINQNLLLSVARGHLARGMAPPVGYVRGGREWRRAGDRAGACDRGAR